MIQDLRLYSRQQEDSSLDKAFDLRGRCMLTPQERCIMLRPAFH